MEPRHRHATTPPPSASKAREDGPIPHHAADGKQAQKRRHVTRHTLIFALERKEEKHRGREKCPPKREEKDEEESDRKEDAEFKKCI